METRTKRDEPVTRPQPSPGRGVPLTFAAHAVRKDVAVRVSMQAPAGEPDELREHGYGHGV